MDEATLIQQIGERATEVLALAQQQGLGGGGAPPEATGEEIPPEVLQFFYDNGLLVEGAPVSDEVLQEIAEQLSPGTYDLSTPQGKQQFIGDILQMIGAINNGG